jgi:hypothetical protein
VLKLTFMPTRTVQPIGGHEPVTHAVRGRPGPTGLWHPMVAALVGSMAPRFLRNRGISSSNRVIGGAEGLRLSRDRFGPAGDRPRRFQDCGRSPVQPTATGKAAPVDAPRPAVGVEGYRDRLAALTKPTPWRSRPGVLMLVGVGEELDPTITHYPFRTNLAALSGNWRRCEGGCEDRQVHPPARG